MNIQRISVLDPNSNSPTVEITIADHHLIDEARHMIVASIRLDESAVSLEDLQIEALKALRDAIDLVYFDMATALGHDDEDDALSRRPMRS